MSAHPAVQRGYQFRFYPTKRQQKLLVEYFGISRWAYNAGLDAISFSWRVLGQRFTVTDVSKAITELATEEDWCWIRKVPRTVITQSLRHLGDAFQRFFAGCSKYPHFKRKQHEQAITFQLDPRVNNWLPGRLLKLPGLGALKLRWSRLPSGRPKQVTLRKRPGGKYFISFSVEESIEVYPESGRACGVDVGIKDLLVTEHWKSGAPKFLEKHERELSIGQRRLARKQKGSKRWHQQRRKNARLHEKIGNDRADFIHKLTTNLIKNHDQIGIETLNVRGMRQNRRLSKSLSDAALSEVHRQLRYKAAWHGRDLRACSQWEPTSKRCSCCGHVHMGLTLSDRHWRCVCGAEHDRDHNAARNILRAAFGGSVEVTGVEREQDGDVHESV